MLTKYCTQHITLSHQALLWKNNYYCNILNTGYFYNMILIHGTINYSSHNSTTVTQGDALLCKIKHSYTTSCATVQVHALLRNTMYNYLRPWTYYSRQFTSMQDDKKKLRQSTTFQDHVLLFKTMYYYSRPCTSI